MADAASNYEERQEFWRPAGFPRLESTLLQNNESACRQCGGDLIAQSQFCHGCGARQRPVLAAYIWPSFRSWRDISSIAAALGQGTASLIALILGCASLTVALLTGFIYTATTLVDWQAVQLWRIEWLLAAIAFFIAGILLKKN
jgi:hypothetical protein